MQRVATDGRNSQGSARTVHKRSRRSSSRPKRSAEAFGVETLAPPAVLSLPSLPDIPATLNHEMKILRPIAHRTVAQQEALTLIRSRNLIVRLRTAAVNAVRGLAKPCGYRLPASSTLCFAQRCVAVLPPGLSRALGPVLHQIADMTVKIKEYDRAIKQLTETEYRETQALLKVYGVGQLTALTYVLTLGSKERFQRSRDVGCYLGLRPKRSQSGERDPQLGITKAGNVYLRSLLVECANHVLGRHGKDSTLRQWGLSLASRGGKQSRNRAIVAVARKLAVLLHSHLGHAAAIHSVLCKGRLRKKSCSTVTMTPCSDDRVSGWALTRPAENWQHRLLLLNPKRHRAITAHAKCE